MPKPYLTGAIQGLTGVNVRGVETAITDKVAEFNGKLLGISLKPLTRIMY